MADEQVKKLALLVKLADKVSPDDLLAFATENLELEDIKALQKEAFGVPGWEGLKEILKRIPEAGTMVGRPSALGLGDLAAKGIPGRAWEAAKYLGQGVAAHPGGAALGAGLAASPFILKWLYDKLTGPSTPEHEYKLSSAGFTPQVRAELEKLAQDPVISLAVMILGQRGLLG